MIVAGVATASACFTQYGVTSLTTTSKPHSPGPRRRPNRRLALPNRTLGIPPRGGNQEIGDMRPLCRERRGIGALTSSPISPDAGNRSAAQAGKSTFVPVPYVRCRTVRIQLVPLESALPLRPSGARKTSNGASQCPHTDHTHPGSVSGVTVFHEIRDRDGLDNERRS